MINNKNEFESLKRSIFELRQSLIGLKELVEKQDKRLSDLELGVNKSSVQSATPEPQTAAPPPPPPPSAIPKSDPRIKFNDDFTPQEHMPEMAKEKQDLEQNIAGKWFARIGLAALVLGISFFLKYAFDNNWIGETGRVIIGIFSGLALLAFGEKTIRKYPVYGQLVSGGGIAVLYLSIFAAFNFYNLIPQVAAFLLMVLITAAGILLSLRYNALSLIIVAVTGGFITPFLVSIGLNEQIELFTYIAILNLAILYVSIFKKWRELAILGFIGTFLVFASWAEEFYSNDQFFSTFFFLTLFFVIYSASSVVYNLAKRENSTGVEQFLTLATAMIYFFSGLAILSAEHAEFKGFFTVILAIYYFIGAHAIRKITPDDKNLYNFMAVLTIGLITLAIPVQFKGLVITLAWFVEAVLLLYLGLKVKRESLKAFGVAIYVLASLRLLIFDSVMNIDNELFILNKPFFTFLFAILAAYLISYTYAKSKSEDVGSKTFTRKTVIALFIVVANLLTIISISREIVTSYDREIKQLRTSQMQSNKLNYGRSINSNNSVSNNINKIRQLENKKSISLSIFWLVYSIIIITIGFVGKYKLVRVGGILLLAVAIFKLFFYDLWSLGTLYRIISSISLGIVLLGISYTYNKYKDKIKEII